MTTFADTLADALRALRNHRTQSELYNANEAADAVLAAYDAKRQLHPSARWHAAGADFIAVIDEIDAATPGGAFEPQWWLDMMAVRREVTRARRR